MAARPVAQSRPSPTRSSSRRAPNVTEVSNLLVPSTKELDKALTLSADRARRMADAFGLKVPGVATKPGKARGGAAATRRAQKA